jgi:hypothetical protein
MFIYSNWVINYTEGNMCDDDSLSLQNKLQSPPRRELKIILQRAEYIFPALKGGLVSVLVFVHTEKKAMNVYFQKVILWNHFSTKLIFVICSPKMLEAFTLLSQYIRNIL